MTNNIVKLNEWVKENIPNAEILEVFHTEKIFSESTCSPKMEGILILIKD